MAFDFTINPNQITLNQIGDFEDVTLQFTDVPADVVKGIMEQWSLNGVSVGHPAQVSISNPNPQDDGATVPVEVSRSIVQPYDEQAQTVVVRYTRVS